MPCGGNDCCKKMGNTLFSKICHDLVVHVFACRKSDLGFSVFKDLQWNSGSCVFTPRQCCGLNPQQRLDEIFWPVLGSTQPHKHQIVLSVWWVMSGNPWLIDRELGTHTANTMPRVCDGLKLQTPTEILSMGLPLPLLSKRLNTQSKWPPVARFLQ